MVAPWDRIITLRAHIDDQNRISRMKVLLEDNDGDRGVSTSILRTAKSVHGTPMAGLGEKLISEFDQDNGLSARELNLSGLQSGNFMKKSKLDWLRRRDHYMFVNETEVDQGIQATTTRFHSHLSPTNYVPYINSRIQVI